MNRTLKLDHEIAELTQCQALVACTVLLVITVVCVRRQMCVWRTCFTKELGELS